MKAQVFPIYPQGKARPWKTWEEVQELRPCTTLKGCLHLREVARLRTPDPGKSEPLMKERDAIGCEYQKKLLARVLPPPS